VRLSANDRITLRYVWRITSPVKARLARDGRAVGHSYPTRSSLLARSCRMSPWDGALIRPAGDGVKRRDAFPKSGACGPQGLFENGPVPASALRPCSAARRSSKRKADGASAYPPDALRLGRADADLVARRPDQTEDRAFKGLGIGNVGLT
jgi:hypothetical protein